MTSCNVILRILSWSLVLHLFAICVMGDSAVDKYPYPVVFCVNEENAVQINLSRKVTEYKKPVGTKSDGDSYFSEKHESIYVAEEISVTLKKASSSIIWTKLTNAPESMRILSAPAEFFSLKAVILVNDTWIFVYYRFNRLFIDYVKVFDQQFKVTGTQELGVIYPNYSRFIEVTCGDPIRISGVPPGKRRFIYDGEKFVPEPEAAPPKEAPK